MELTPRETRLEKRKTLAVENLSVQFSHNNLPMAEYERLVEYINKTESEREMAIIERIVDESALYAGDEPAPLRDAALPGDWNRTKFHFSLLSSRKVAGESLSRRHCSFVNILGSTVIDIAEGDLPRGRTEVDILNLLGETKIIVPPGLAVIVKTIPIAGAVFMGRGLETRPDAGGRELVVTGAVLLGNISVKLRKVKRGWGIGGRG
jgi:hypothetical protein